MRFSGLFDSSKLFVAAALACLALTAHAQSRGWLRYADGNLLSGELVETNASGGVFIADRFGRLNFGTSEARFEAASEAAPSDTNAPTSATSVASMPMPISVPESGWIPNDWSIGVSGYWQRDNGSVSSDFGLDLDSTWKRPRDEVKLTLSTDYKVVDGDVDRNEQTGGVRWMRKLNAPWFGLARVQAKRSTFSFDPLPEMDYLLLQATAGVGLRKDWSAKNYSLVALGHDEVILSLLKRDVRLYVHATSLLLENNLRLMPRVTLTNTLYAYSWSDGGNGFDSRADISYELSDRVSVGLRHEFRSNAVNLELGTYSRLSLTTRVGF